MPTSNAQLRKDSRAGSSLANAFGVGRFSKRLGISAIVLGIAIACVAQNTPTQANQPHDLTVLILGDSLGLCGFSKRLDQKFRDDPRVKSVFTYCTCGTNPLSWLKEKP